MEIIGLFSSYSKTLINKARSDFAESIRNIDINQKNRGNHHPGSQVSFPQEYKWGKQMIFKR